MQPTIALEDTFANKSIASINDIWTKYFYDKKLWWELFKLSSDNILLDADKWNIAALFYLHKRNSLLCAQIKWALEMPVRNEI